MKAEEEEEQRDADAHLHEVIFHSAEAGCLVPVWYWYRPRDFSARRIDAELTLSPCRSADG